MCNGLMGGYLPDFDLDFHGLFHARDCIIYINPVHID